MAGARERCKPARKAYGLPGLNPSAITQSGSCSTMATTPVFIRGICCTNWDATPQRTGLATWRDVRPRVPGTAGDAAQVGYNAAFTPRSIMSNSDRIVDFGFEKVAWAEKALRVRSVFASVASKYDIMFVF